jgi:dienelactone hydrolase
MMKKVLMLCVVVAVAVCVFAPAAQAHPDYRPWKQAMVTYWNAHHINGPQPAIVATSNVWGSQARATAAKLRLWNRAVAAVDAAQLQRAQAETPEQESAACDALMDALAEKDRVSDLVPTRSDAARLGGFTRALSIVLRPYLHH